MSVGHLIARLVATGVFAPIALAGCATEARQPDPAERAAPAAAFGVVTATESAQVPDHTANEAPFTFEFNVRRNHLVFVGTVVERLDDREYGRVNLKVEEDPGTPEIPLDEQGESPGMETTVHQVAVETVLKGTIDSSTVLVEELAGFPEFEFGTTYLFVAAPWHDGTYQAGTTGALTEGEAGIVLRNGEATPDLIGEQPLAGMTFDELVASVTELVDSQVGGELGAVAPIPTRSYNLAHIWSLHDVAAVTVGGQAVADDALAAIVAALDGPIEAGPGAVTKEGTVELVLTYSGTQTFTAQLTPDGSAVVASDGTRLPLPEAAREMLAVASGDSQGRGP